MLSPLQSEPINLLQFVLYPLQPKHPVEQYKEENIYFGLWIHQFQSIVTCPYLCEKNIMAIEYVEKAV